MIRELVRVEEFSFPITLLKKLRKFEGCFGYTYN